MQARAAHEQLDLGQKPKQKIGVVEDVGLHNPFPRAERGAIDLTKCRIECQGQSGLLIFVLLFAEGYEIGNAGILVILEIEAENLIQGVARLKGLGVDRQHACLGRAELGIQIYADGHAADFSHATSQLCELFVKLTVVIRLGKLTHAIGKTDKRRAMQIDARAAHAAVENVHAGNVKLNLGHGGEIGRRILSDAFTLKPSQLGNVLQDGNKPRQRIGQLGIVQHIREGCVTVGNDRRIGREKIIQRTAARVEDLQHAQLLQGVHIDIGNIFTQKMCPTGGGVRVEEAEAFKFHRKSFLHRIIRC